MFEETLVASRIDAVSAEKRWTVAASIGLQVMVASVVIALPLMHPEMLPFHVETPKVLVPVMPKPPAPVQVERISSAASSAEAVSVTRLPTVPSLFPTSKPVVEDAPPIGLIGPGMGTRDGVPVGMGLGGGPVVSMTPMKTAVGPVHVSTGVLQGMLIAPIRPVYPPIARAAGVSGTVVVDAVISRTGTIESLHVVSGPQMLQNAALEAIREARYEPYRLNGEVVEVETRITVNFRMGG
jgi:periplasmic protein TonB